MLSGWTRWRGAAGSERGSRYRDGLIGLVVLGGATGALTLTALLGATSAAALTLHGLALAGGVGAYIQARSARRAAEKLSSELDAISHRLLSLEARPTTPSAPVGDAGAGVRNAVAEVTGEIALLSNLVRDLAVTVTAHDRAIVALHDEGEPRPAATPMAAPERVSLAPMEVIAPSASWPHPSPLPSWSAPARAEPFESETHPKPASKPLVALRDEALLSDAVDARRLAAILDAFEHDRIELHLQPVVSLPQRKARVYEMLARLRLADGGGLLIPAEFLPSLERCGLAAELDRRMVARAALVIRHLTAKGSEAVVSCNLSPVAFAEPGFLRSLGRVFDSHPDAVGRLVLEVSQRCWRTLDAECAGALATLRDRGVPFALDRAGDLRLDPLTLADRGVRYLKLPVDLLLRPAQGRSLDLALGDLATVLARAGIRLVAERVEREEDVPDLIDLGVPLAQGHLFAPPRAIRPDVLSGVALQSAPVRPEPRPAPPASDPPAAAPGTAPDRAPFRSFLRRAV